MAAFKPPGAPLTVPPGSRAANPCQLSVKPKALASLPGSVLVLWQGPKNYFQQGSVNTKGGSQECRVRGVEG